MFLKHVPFTHAQEGADHLATGEGRNHASTTYWFSTWGDFGTFGHVWRHFQVSLLDGEVCRHPVAKMPTRIPLKSYSAQLPAREISPGQVAAVVAEVPAVVGDKGFQSAQTSKQSGG